MRDDARSGWWIPLSCALALALAGVLLYVRHYGAPGLYNADNLICENMYRDLFVKGNPWSLWGLSGAAQYAELALYFVLRWGAGDMQVAWGLHTALMGCLFAGGAAWAMLGIVEDEEGRATILAAAPILAVLYPLPDVVHFFAGKTVHGLTLIAAFYGYGFFLRFMRRPQGRLSLAFALALGACLRASDKLFLLWLLIPAAAMCVWLFRKGRMGRREAGCWLLLTVLCELAGRCIDAGLRNVPTHFDPFDFDVVRVCRLLGDAALQTWSYAVASPFAALWFVAALAGLALTRRTGTIRQRDGIVFLLLAMLLNLLGIAAAGRDEFRYMSIFYLMPYIAGGPLFLAWAARRLFAGRAGKLRGALPVAALIVPLVLALDIRSALPVMHPPYSPELAEEMDELARTHGVRTGIADYNTAWIVNIFSREGVTLLPLWEYGHQFLTVNCSRVILRDRVDMLLDNPAAEPFNRLNRELEIRANGEPDEIVPLKNGKEALIYRQGAHHPAEAELVLDGKRLMPERAEGDRVQWTGSLRLAGDLTLTEVRTLPRNGRHLALLVFKEPREAILGKELVLSAVGDKLSRHKRVLALRMSREGDGWLDWLYALFMPQRRLVVTMENSAVLPDGSGAAWGKLPAWNSREWLALFVDDGERRHRIK